ncbi:DUF600 domain-containing protein [Fictibacillus aquaticus]|uniref:DUF600 domain-containing protein n=1 Tax=Fictibacillus aquaticus TaxID=2021314 RepID=A0A235F744_9BACL|nr:DUF600 domain-containing protein [Fictibacillus aquaticus]OYD57166.1 DUF600 domain-containing protein [Fictibacillus aquaticus]
MKVFEDYFSELQADMVAICLEYVEEKADDIFIYCSYEPTIYVFDFFYKINGSVIHKHQLNEISNLQYDVSSERQKAALKIGNENLKLIHKKCKEFNRDMPTEIKLHYDVKKNSLRANYKYELIYTNEEELMPDDIFDNWFEEVKEGNLNN